jgi:hypothetical protein
MLDQIEQCIQKGVDKGYFQELAFTGCGNAFEADITEYLFTVNVAQQLLEAKQANRWNSHSICLEYSADQFKANAFPLFLLQPRRDRRPDHASIRAGRIDTVVLHSPLRNHWRSFVGIELKGINPQLDLVIDDLRRLADAMLATDPIAPNSIERGYCAFVLRLYNGREALEADEIRENIRARRAALERAVTDALRNTIGIEVSIDVWEIWVRGATQEAESIPEDLWEYGDIARETGGVIGVLIRLRPT